VLGEHTQREAGYLSEIALEECLKVSRLVVYDSSLRDVGFWRRNIARIKPEYPQVAHAIYHCVAPRDVIHARARQRARRTGRYVPPEVRLRGTRTRSAAAAALRTGGNAPRQVLQEAIDAAPLAFEELRSLVDFAAVLDTSGAAPRLVSPSAQAFAEHARSMRTAGTEAKL
jgi:hypothetical protein